MILGVYVIYDKDAAEYSSPYTAVNLKVACRGFVQTVNQSLFKDAYSLINIGTFDTENGSFNVFSERTIKSAAQVDEVLNGE